MANGPLQNLANINVTFDANGSLIVFAKAGGTVGPGQNFANAKGCCESNNQLVVVFK